ncbi:UTP--glucose-1-phosphate uridylyltransferase [Brucepastera parasyntrophica]|uniref:UTP--glucose-1-phosphate uridylyltransferase n=1 Tax=Brucepastera parasyntrophica TaxID=2880008 RepID=UPI0034E222E0
MTSVLTDTAVNQALLEYETFQELTEIAAELGCPPIEMSTASQSMMAAITHSSFGKPRRIFDTAYGKPDCGLPLPGGHGQNFEILAGIYRNMYEQGIRYVWLGNVDNLGFTVDPVSLAVFALSGTDAAFEASYRTPMDVKGGILVSDRQGKITCADIGPAITIEKVHEFETEGKHILFNCGIGLFDLKKLIEHLDFIPYELPLRITDQDKDAGLYAQMEQITWEIIGLIPKPFFFAVEKSKRFVASKMLMENIITSLPPDNHNASEMGKISGQMHKGLNDLLKTEYLLNLQNKRWVPDA